MQNSRLFRKLIVILCVVLATGCASVKPKGLAKRETTATVKPSTSEAVETYEQQRANALYQAACTRSEDDDLEACETTLRQLLTLQPTHKLGRLLLADLYAATDRRSEAEQELTVLLQTSPKDPQIHHAMGLLLESQGQTRKAIEHLEKSVRLEPDNELYALSYETLCATQTASIKRATTISNSKE